jgi:hypothetical protein
MLRPPAPSLNRPTAVTAPKLVGQSSKLPLHLCVVTMACDSGVGLKPQKRVAQNKVRSVHQIFQLVRQVQRSGLFEPPGVNICPMNELPAGDLH